MYNAFFQQFGRLSTVGYLDVRFNLHQIVKEKFSGSIQLPFYYTIWFTENYRRLPKAALLRMISRSLFFFISFNYFLGQH